MVERNKFEARLWNVREKPASLCERNECFVGRKPEARRALYDGNVVTGGPVESFGRTWFLETLLPSGRKHRALGYERAPDRFLRTLRFAPRKLFKDEKTAYPFADIFST